MPTLATNGSRDDVQAKIDAAGPGDVVTLPPGEASWTGGISNARGVSLQGSGGTRVIARSTSAVEIGTGHKTFELKSVRAKKTLAEYFSVTAGQSVRVWRMGGSTGWHATNSVAWMDGTVVSYDPATKSIVVNVASVLGSGSHPLWFIETRPVRTTISHDFPGTLFNITEHPAVSVGISDIAFTSTVSSDPAGSIIRINGVGNAQPVRIHDCSFQQGQNPAGGNAISILALTNKGVVSDCSLFNRVFGESTFAIETKGTGVEDSSWSRPSTMGILDTDGKKNFYLEDCDCTGYLNATDFADTSRAVARHVMFNNCGVGTHGADSDPDGQRHLEMYDCEQVIDYVPGLTLHVIWAIFFRGGTGVITDNIFAGPNGDWNPAGILLACLNLGADHGGWTGGYPVPHQVGRGFITAENQLEPLYAWNNVGLRIDLTGGVTPPGGHVVADYIQVGRDYYLTAHPTWAKPGGLHPAAYPHPLRTAGSVPPPIPTPEPPEPEPPPPLPPAGEAPEIIVWPSSQTVKKKTDVTFTVSATGTATILYQWYRNGALIVGAKSPSLFLPRVNPGDAGKYMVTVTNDFGGEAPAATLSVR